jgi:DeoR/GlpR family transcriptional regulator of sugar metabolism
MPDSCDDQGRYVETTSSKSILSILGQADDPVLTAAEMADELDVSRETARRKLTELHNKRKVGRKEVGARAVAWWLKS